MFYLEKYAKDIRLTNISIPILRNFNESIENIKSIYKKHGRKVAFLYMIREILCEATILNIGVYVYLIYQLMVTKTIIIGDFMGIASAAEQLIWRMESLMSIIPKFAEHALYIEKFNDFLSYENKILQGDTNIKPIDSIELKNVSFRYDENSSILDGINLSIKKGEKIAIVGYNGAGKTTLIKLLLRLYDTTEGEILINGIDIKQLDLDGYRKKTATLFQDFKIFATTISNNITMDNSIVYDDIMKYSLEKSQLIEKIEKLKLGLETNLTKEFDDNGTTLSGGESQKLAIARMIYKQGDLFILDEPQSMLDPISEYNFNKTLLDVAKDKTAIFISHRLNSTILADKIIVINNGKIVEEGNHKTLINENKLYAKMWKAQDYSV